MVKTLVAAGAVLFAVICVPASAQRCIGQDCNRDRTQENAAPRPPIAPQGQQGNSQLFYPRQGSQQQFYPQQSYPRQGSQQLFYPKPNPPQQVYPQPVYPQQVYPLQVYPLARLCVVIDVGTCQVAAPPGSYCECRNDFGEIFSGTVE